MSIPMVDEPRLPVEPIEKALKAQECAQLIILRMPRSELRKALSGVLGKEIGPDVVERFLEMLNVARVALKVLDREGVEKVRAGK
jgi:hypothetical protein